MISIPLYHFKYGRKGERFREVKIKLSLFLLVHFQAQEKKQALVEGLRGGYTTEGSVALQFGPGCLGPGALLPLPHCSGSFGSTCPGQTAQLGVLHTLCGADLWLCLVSVCDCQPICTRDFSSLQTSGSGNSFHWAVPGFAFHSWPGPFCSRSWALTSL